MKNQIGIVLFFLVTFITSCLVFNSRKFKDVTYTHEMLANDVNLLNGITIIAKDNAIAKKDAFLLLFNGDTLKRIVSNDLRKTKQFDITYLEKNAFYLTRSHEGGMFDRMGIRNIDSIFIKDGLVIHKKGAFARYENSRDYARLNDIKIYVQMQDGINVYKLIYNETIHYHNEKESFMEYGLISIAANYKSNDRFLFDTTLKNYDVNKLFREKIVYTNK